jgi:hypothetical protein
MPEIKKVASNGGQYKRLHGRCHTTLRYDPLSAPGAIAAR